MLSITLSSKKYNISIDLHQKATIIIGDSGRGKSLFTKLVIENVEYNNKDVKIGISDIDYSLKVLDSNWYSTIDGVISNNEKVVFIADDVDFIITSQFSEIYKRCINCYFIIINRFGDLKLPSMSRVNFNDLTIK